MYSSLLLVILAFVLSTVLVLAALRTLPITLDEFPQTVHDIVALSRALRDYSRSDYTAALHVIAVLSLTAVWKHAWSIPGSVIWNVIAGALFSPLLATFLLTLLTTLGSVAATVLAMPLAPFLLWCFPKAFDVTRAALEGDSSFSIPFPVSAPSTPTTPKFPTSPPLQHSQPPSKSQTWIRLSILRLIGIVPWSLLNIASGVCRIPLLDCCLGAFVGSLPWTTVTCQIGSLLQTLSSQTQSQSLSSLIFTPQIIMRLVLLTALSLAPILGRSWLQSLLGDDSQPKELFLSEKAKQPIALKRPPYPKFQPQPKHLSRSLTGPIPRSRVSRARDRASWGSWVRRSLSLPPCEKEFDLSTHLREKTDRGQA